MHMVTHALVLREVNYKESDKILTVLTRENGKMTLYEYQGRWAVKEAVTDREFAGMRGDIEKLALGCYFAEMAELLSVEDVPAPELLSLLLNSLHALDKMDTPAAQVKAAFELKIMCLAGYEPVLDACAVCGVEPEQPAFHLSEGVLHCAACREEVGEGISMPLSPSAVSAMRHVAYGDPKRLFSFRLDDVSLKQMGDTCEAYVLTQLERGFGTLDFYKQISMPV